MGLDSTQPYAICGRNMDWGQDMDEKLFVFPRKMQRSSDSDVVRKNAIPPWESKYGSVITSVYDRATTDGMNEAGLAGHALWLGKTDYGQRDPDRPGIDANRVLQYFLDNFATVKEVVDHLREEKIQIVKTYVPSPIGPKEIKCHLAMEDAKGESLIVEYVEGKNGEPDIFYSGEVPGYQGEYDVLTNDPVFEKQLENLKKYDGFGGKEPLPGTTDAAERFVRAAFYLKSLPDPENQREAIAGVLSVMRSSAQPFRNPSKDKEYESATRWRTVSDLEQKLYMYESSLYPNLVWIKLDNIDFDKLDKILVFDLTKHREAIGDISDCLEKNTCLEETTQDIFAPAS